jgi:hypothetical protein
VLSTPTRATRKFQGSWLDSHKMFTQMRPCLLRAASTLHQLRRASRLLVTRPHRLYVSLTVHRECSSPGYSGSTSTTPCITTTRLRLHALYVNIAVRRDYSSPATRALRQPHCAPRLLVTWPHRLYVNLAVCRGYSSLDRSGSTSTTLYAAATSSSGRTTNSTTHLDWFQLEN